MVTPIDRQVYLRVWERAMNDTTGQGQPVALVTGAVIAADGGRTAI